jgi:hypothetical protein
LTNITGEGENHSYPLALIKQIASDVGPTRPLRVLYDIGCTLNKFLDLLNIFYTLRNKSFAPVIDQHALSNASEESIPIGLDLIDFSDVFISLLRAKLGISAGVQSTF